MIILYRDDFVVKPDGSSVFDTLLDAHYIPREIQKDVFEVALALRSITYSDRKDK